MQKRQTNRNNFLFFSLLSLLAIADTKIYGEPSHTLSQTDNPLSFLSTKIMPIKENRVARFGVSKGILYLAEMLDLKNRGKYSNMAYQAVKDNDNLRNAYLLKTTVDLFRMKAKKIKNSGNMSPSNLDLSSALNPLANIALNGLTRFGLEKYGLDKLLDEQLSRWISNEKMRSIIKGFSKVVLMDFVNQELGTKLQGIKGAKFFSGTAWYSLVLLEETE